MLGSRGPQRGLLEADNLFADFVGRDSFYGFLASQRDVLFRDEDFAQLYCAQNGRPSVPPSLLATALVLQTHDRVSDEEAKERADYDLRWKVALGVGVEDRPFAKSTLQEFRAQLVVHEEQGAIFKKSLELAKGQGYFRGKAKLKIALDTAAILGQGAVKDTYNLLADGIRLVLRALGPPAYGGRVEQWAEREGFGRYVAEESLKGQAEINWEDPQERRLFLQGIVADAERVLEQVRQARSRLPEGSPEGPSPGGRGRAVEPRVGAGHRAAGGWAGPAGRGSPRPYAFGTRSGDAPRAEEQSEAVRRPQGAGGGGYREPNDHGGGRAGGQRPRPRASPGDGGGHGGGHGLSGRGDDR